MSAKRKRVKYCNVFRYLQDTDPELADAISEACAEQALNSGPAGLTFLIPTDKEVRKELIDGVYGTEPEKVGDLIRALIIPQAIPSLGDFPIGRGPANRLRQHLDIKKKDKDSVELHNGAKIRAYTKPPGFSAWSNRQLVIYALEGKIPLDGPEAERPTGRRPKPKTGGGVHGGGFDRAAVAAEVEKRYAEMMSKSREDCECYTNAVCSLMMFFKKNHPEALKKALQVFDYCTPVTFYLLLEPNLASGHYIPDAAFEGWDLSASGPINQPKSALLALLDEAELPFDPTKAYGAVNMVRNKTTDIDKAGLPRRMREIYAEVFANKGTLGGVQVVDTALVSMEKKLWQDEFRFRFSAQFRTWKEQRFCPEEFRNFQAYIRDLMSGADPLAECILTDAMYWRRKINPSLEFASTTFAFFKCSDFMYVFTPPKQLSELGKKVEITGGYDSDDDAGESVYGDDGGESVDPSTRGGCGCANMLGGRHDAFLGGKDSKVSKATRQMAIELVRCISEKEGLPKELEEYSRK